VCASTPRYTKTKGEREREREREKERERKRGIITHTQTHTYNIQFLDHAQYALHKLQLLDKEK
jgi:hypothetical protein